MPTSCRRRGALPRPRRSRRSSSAKRLWTQISWLALLGKTIEVEELELDGFVARLDRLKDGVLLPKPVPSEAPEEPEPEQPPSWSFAADSVALRDGQIFFRDFTVGEEPQRFDLAVKDLSARELALVVDPAGREPGHLVISAQIGEGSIGLDSQVESRAAGPAAVSKITLANLPVGGVRGLSQVVRLERSHGQARRDARAPLRDGRARTRSREASRSRTSS